MKTEKDIQELEKRIADKEYLNWFAKELEELLNSREQTLENVIRILRENQVKEEVIKDSLVKYFGMEDEEAEIKMKKVFFTEERG